MNYYANFSETEAFAHARRFYDSLIGDFDRYRESQRVVADAESTVFRPALELQVAGLCLLAGKPRNDIYLPVSFAFFIVDHLAVGWTAMMASQFRVAYSLSRSIVEASIFEVASSVDRNRFSNLWSKPAGTGGRVLQQISPRIPDKLRTIFSQAWNMTRSLGHASFMPVISSAQIVSDHAGKTVGVMTFGGPYIEPLNEGVLEHLSFIYGVSAMAGIEAMECSLIPNAAPCAQWNQRYDELMRRTKEIADGALEKLDMKT